MRAGPLTASSVAPAMTVTSSSSGSARSAQEQSDAYVHGLGISDQTANRRSRWSMTEAELATSSSPYTLASPAGRSMPENIHGEDGLRTRHMNHSRHPGQPTLSHLHADDPSQHASGSVFSSPQALSPSLSSDYVVAVVGHESVGKSTVIRRAIKTWGGSPITTSFTPDGFRITSHVSEVKAGGRLAHDSKVEFVEVNIRALDISGIGEVFPPGMSPVSGLILCYDAHRQETLHGLSEVIQYLSPDLPMVLFACKSDPDDQTEVDAQVGDSIGQPYNVGLIEVTTATKHGKHKMRTGLRWLLHRLEERLHHRSPVSDDSMMEDSPQTVSTERTASEHSTEEYSDAHSSASSFAQVVPNWDDEDIVSAQSTPTLEETQSKEAAVDSPVEKVPDQRVIAPSSDSSEPPHVYVTTPELMNELFTAVVSTENNGFVQSFFSTFRRFLHPKDLMAEFVERFTEVEQYAVSRDIRLWALMKITSCLCLWTKEYPGDLADHETQGVFRDLLAIMLRYSFLAHLTVELVKVEQNLHNVVDIDRSWACAADTNTPPTPATIPPTTPAADPDSGAAIELVVDKEHLFDEPEEMNGNLSVVNTLEKPTSTRSMSSSNLSVDATGRPSDGNSFNSSDSNSDYHRSLSTDPNSQRWANAINTITTTDAHVFAVELTKIQWQMFANIRARDILRHDIGKERDDPVGQAIDFFNHLSRWVSTMILAHPKPKVRAKVYEAFVRIARRLRKLNNYDSLCAVIAGLRETSIHRLGQTHALVKLDPLIMRDFQSHMRLMDARGGYTHYRRALQADATYGHAAIPLLSTVLSLVSKLQAARPEDRRSDGKIQWAKFSRMGEILAVIPDFQARGSMVPGNATTAFRRLIEATPVIMSEDGLYERSKMLEPAGSQPQGMFRKLASLAL